MGNSTLTGNLDVTSNTNLNENLTVNGSTTMNGTLDMQGHRINNVANGVSPGDALNMSQLQRAQQEARAGISTVAALNGIPVAPPGMGTYK